MSLLSSDSSKDVIEDFFEVTFTDTKLGISVEVSPIILAVSLSKLWNSQLALLVILEAGLLSLQLHQVLRQCLPVTHIFYDK